MDDLLQMRRNAPGVSATHKDEMLAALRAVGRPCLPVEVARAMNEESASRWCPVGQRTTAGVHVVGCESLRRVTAVLDSLRRDGLVTKTTQPRMGVCYEARAAGRRDAGEEDLLDAGWSYSANRGQWHDPDGYDDDPSDGFHSLEDALQIHRSRVLASRQRRYA